MTLAQLLLQSLLLIGSRLEPILEMHGRDLGLAQRPLPLDKILLPFLINLLKIGRRPPERQYVRYQKEGVCHTRDGDNEPEFVEDVEEVGAAGEKAHYADGKEGCQAAMKYGGADTAQGHSSLPEALLPDLELLRWLYQ